MKKLILLAVTALFCLSTAVQAQKINEESILAKLEKSDADIANEKKSTKANTWLNRAKAYMEAVTAPTIGVFEGMDMQLLKLTLGEATSTGAETINEVAYETFTYPYLVIYAVDGKVKSWKQTKFIKEGAVDTAIAAYEKAYELDPKTAEKVKEGLVAVSNYESQLGNVGIAIAEYKSAAAAFAKSYAVQSIPVYNEKDDMLIYYAGYLLTIDGASDPKSYVDGEKYLTEAIAANYNDEEGNIYYYLFHCLYGQKEADKAFVIKAKDALLEGVAKYPKNERILDGLMQLYTGEDGVGDPADLVSLIDAAIADDPTNVDLWFGRGRIFYALEDYDNSIESFKKVVEISPDLFEANYYLGLFYAVKGDAMNKEVNGKQYNSQVAYDEDLKKVNDIYLASIPWFERALELKATDLNSAESLKSICFRLRDEEGMMAKYDKYNAIFKELKGIE